MAASTESMCFRSDSLRVYSCMSASASERDGRALIGRRRRTEGQMDGATSPNGREQGANATTKGSRERYQEREHRAERRWHSWHRAVPAIGKPTGGGAE